MLRKLHDSFLFWKQLSYFLSFGFSGWPDNKYNCFPNPFVVCPRRNLGKKSQIRLSMRKVLKQRDSREKLPHKSNRYTFDTGYTGKVLGFLQKLLLSPIYGVLCSAMMLGPAPSVSLGNPDKSSSQRLLS